MKRNSFPWSDWNDADKTLLAALVIFLGCLCVHLQYPASILAEGMLFCAEAALVGGLADWFAVTALFERPLGFPYHTAILPSRRDAFIKASVTMVQKEFFSRRKIFRHLEKLHIMPMLLEWLNKPETEARLTRRVLHYLRDYLLYQDREAQARIIAERFKAALAEIRTEDICSAFGRYMSSSGRDRELLARLAYALRQQAEAPSVRQAIEAHLEEYEKECTQDDFWSQLAAGFLEATSLVDLEEAAALMQKQMLALLDELAQQGSPLQEELLALFYQTSAEVSGEQEFQALVQDLKVQMIEKLPAEKAVACALQYFRTQLTERVAEGSEDEHLPVLRSQMEELIRQEYRRMEELLRTDSQMQASVGRFLHDLIARSALHAQSLVGVIVATVLSRLTDKQLNHLVYDKVEPDLLWIRMNGSIVGAGIGLILFALLHVIALF